MRLKHAKCKAKNGKRSRAGLQGFTAGIRTHRVFGCRNGTGSGQFIGPPGHRGRTTAQGSDRKRHRSGAKAGRASLVLAGYRDGARGSTARAAICRGSRRCRVLRAQRHYPAGQPVPRRHVVDHPRYRLWGHQLGIRSTRRGLRRRLLLHAQHHGLARPLRYRDNRDLAWSAGYAVWPQCDGWRYQCANQEAVGRVRGAGESAGGQSRPHRFPGLARRAVSQR